MICTRVSWINVKFLPKTASFLTNNSYIRMVILVICLGDIMRHAQNFRIV